MIRRVDGCVDSAINARELTVGACNALRNRTVNHKVKNRGFKVGTQAGDMMIKVLCSIDANLNDTFI
jgi:hypothetical protein